MSTIGDIGAGTTAEPGVCYCSVGSAIFTNDDELAKRLRQVCNHAAARCVYHDVVG